MKKKEAESKVSLEELFSSIEETLTGLEDERISLEEAFTLYQKGISLVKQCSDRIDHVEKEIRILNEAGGKEDEDEL